MKGKEGSPGMKCSLMKEGSLRKEGFLSGVMKHSHTAYDLSILQEQHLIYEYTETHLLTKLSLITYLITFKYHKSK